MNLSKGVKITLVQAPLAAGQTGATGASVDMTGFDGVMFVGIVGEFAGAALLAVTAYQSSDDSTFNALSEMNALVDDNDTFLLIDVYRPTDRYVRTTVARAGNDITYGGTIAIQYRARKKPTAHDAATLAAEVLGISPDEV